MEIWWPKAAKKPRPQKDKDNMIVPKKKANEALNSLKKLLNIHKDKQLKNSSKKVGPHTLSKDGEKDIAIQELAELKKNEGKTSEQAYDEAKRAVNQSADGMEHPNNSVWERFTKNTNSFDGSGLPTGTKIAAGTAATGFGAGATGLLSRSPDEEPSEELKASETLGEAPEKIENKSVSEHEKAEDAVKKVVDDERSVIDKQIKILMKGADPTAVEGLRGYQPYKFDRTDFGERLQTDLETIGSKYETELKGLDDKAKEGKDRAAMKSLLKGLIDAAALLYLAKHAPSAKYTSSTDKDEYEKELNRLDKHMNIRRDMIKEKFAELRAATKERYRQETRLEDDRKETHYRDWKARRESDEEFNRAKRDMAKQHSRSGEKAREIQLKELHRRRSKLDKDEAAGMPKPPKPITDQQKLMELERVKDKNLNFLDKLGKEYFNSPQEVAATALAVGYTEQEAKDVAANWDAGMFDEGSLEQAYQYVPTNEELLQRQLGLVGGAAPTAPASNAKTKRERLEELRRKKAGN